MAKTSILLSTLAAFVGAASLNAQAAPIDFNRDIRPLLSDNCFHCHGPDDSTREAELRLDGDFTNQIAKLIVPGKPTDSELFKRISSGDGDLTMPPPGSGKTLSEAETELIKDWIQQGAKWSRHWAYVTPVKVETPSTRFDAWSDQWIDRFIARRLEEHSLEPAPRADRITLLRRLSFDLTGLPPTPIEVKKFLADKSSRAIEKQVDRLLSSPAFGERMAVYWLDLVRYADTVGYHGDQDHSISPYRDYVIDAFNRNVRFDQFTREQLAGDLLDHPTTEQIIATGYNRLLQTSHEGGVQKKEYLAMYAADRIRNFSAVWMGATMGCCECHDHKYDPYTAHDFYSMVSFFADVDEAQHFHRGGNSLPTARPPELNVQTHLDLEKIAKLKARIADKKQRLVSATEESRRAQLKAEIDSLSKQLAAREMTKRRTMITVSIKPREIRLLPRGDWLNETGPVMSPAIPKFLGVIKARGQRPTRLDLANWLTDRNNGVALLTARVMVNRFWFLMFGRGLARDLDDFGGQGEPPSHPELLDRLAHEFVDSGWDVKHMMKLIALSRTYQQSSSLDAKSSDVSNRWLARQNRFRISAEFVRDSALAISGLLVDEIGGPSVKPYQPAGYYRHLNFPTRKYSADKNEQQWRRGLYVHWQRQFLHPMLKAFDAPRREECTAQRTQSNTPLSALALMNDPTFLEAARAFASKIAAQAEKRSVEQSIAFAFNSAVSRTPTARETEILSKLYDSSRRSFQANAKSASEFLAVGISEQNTLADPVELAAWTSVARAILNMAETTYRE